ncbi:xanthine dehydrogenase family protein subunit M [Rapidithrix thailandica]|uniref:Xanthine dehydrogenase family protein subunit M n=1 Tax=Rapidithrix thailandica TaxID=413964 RepID=A0AAW9S8W3_9BACT
MIPETFEYYKPSTLDEAIKLLQEYGFDAKLLAGGHSLIPSMKLRLSSPEKIIDISKISDLNFIRAEGNSLVIGACTTHHQIASSQLVQQKVPVLAQTAALIGDLQVRNKGTIGGSLAHADPAADYPATILISEAEIVVQGPSGTRSIPATNFFTGIFMTDIQDDEILREIRIPFQAPHSHATYLKFAQPASRYAIVGCAVMITKPNDNCDDVRVAFTSVADYAFRDSQVENMLKGKKPTEDAVSQAAEKAAEGQDILEDHFAKAPYRKHLARLFAKRAINDVLTKF